MVYELLDQNGEPFYIGKGNKRRTNRTLTCKNNNPLKTNKINKIKEITGSFPQVKILCKGTEEYCLDIEKKLIKLYGKRIDGTGILCNITDGGEGFFGVKCSEERKLKLSKFFKEHNPMQNPEFREKVRLSKLGSKNAMYGKSPSIETRKKIGLAHSGEKHWCFGKHRSEETKNKIRLSNLGKIVPWTGKKQSSEQIEKIRNSRCKTLFKIISPENQITETKFLHLFCKNNNLNSGHMYQVLKGKMKSYKGWKVEVIN